MAGSLICDDGLTAQCTGASQTGFFDCINRDEGKNGAVKDS